MHSAPSRHEGIQAGGRSERLPPAMLQPPFLFPWAQGALLTHRNETKPEDGGGTSAEHGLSSGWRRSGKCLCPLSPAAAEVAPQSFPLRRQEQTLLYPTAYFPKTCW